MTNNKDDRQPGVPSPIAVGSDREFESQGKDRGSEQGGKGQKAGSQATTDSGEVSTAGGREGNFSDSKRDDEDQWSPGSNQSSDH